MESNGEVATRRKRIKVLLLREGIQTPPKKGTRGLAFLEETAVQKGPQRKAITPT